MTLVNHAKWSALAAALLAPALGRRALAFWAAAVFVDLDHLPTMIRRCGADPRALVRFALTFRYPPDRAPTGMRMARPLHTPLAPLALLALRRRWSLATPLALGLVFHYYLDSRDRALGIALSDAATDQADYRCQSCGVYDGRLQAHWREGRCPPQSPVPVEQLSALCDRCHAQAHIG